MTEGVYRNVGSLAEYWRKLVQDADNDEDAWDQLRAQMAKGYLICDPPVTVEQLQEPALRFGGRSVSRAEPRLMVKPEDGVPIDAAYYRATLILAKPTPPPAAEIAEALPSPPKAVRREADKARTTPATMTKAEVDATR
jgi:hypothetical protein